MLTPLNLPPPAAPLPPALDVRREGQEVCSVPPAIQARSAALSRDAARWKDAESDGYRLQGVVEPLMAGFCRFGVEGGTALSERLIVSSVDASILAMSSRNHRSSSIFFTSNIAGAHAPVAPWPR